MSEFEPKTNPCLTALCLDTEECNPTWRGGARLYRCLLERHETTG